MHTRIRREYTRKRASPARFSREDRSGAHLQRFESALSENWIARLARIENVRDRPAPPPRAEPREILELRQLRSDQPELAQAIDLQIDLLQLLDAQRGLLRSAQVFF